MAEISNKLHIVVLLLLKVNHIMCVGIHNMPYVPCLPFCSHLRIERIIEFNDPPTLLLQGAWILYIVAHQLPEGHKLLIPVQVIVVACVMDLNMKYVIKMPMLGLRQRERKKDN